MIAKDISGFLSAGLCIAIFLMAGLLGTGAAEQSYYGLYPSSAPQTAQERAELFKAMQSADGENALQSVLTGADLYKALQNPYEFKDPQAELELANTYKELQKRNAAYSNSRSVDNWYYWTNMWLNGPEEATATRYAINNSGIAQDLTKIYSALDNPFAYRDPQAALELANTYKQLQKYNSVYSSSRSDDNWYYWTNMWLNGA
jgi:hypothetical protein